MANLSNELRGTTEHPLRESFSKTIVINRVVKSEAFWLGQLLAITVLIASYSLVCFFLNRLVAIRIPSPEFSQYTRCQPLGDLIAGLTFNPVPLWAGFREGKMIGSLVAAIVAIILIVYPLQDLGRQVLFEADLSPQQFAAYIEDHTEQDALIEVFDREIDFLSERRYHHPSSEVFVHALKDTLDQNPDSLSYDPWVFGAKYLVDGPYSKLENLYPDTWLSRCCRKIGTIGQYDLYAVLNVTAHSQSDD